MYDIWLCIFVLFKLFSVDWPQGFNIVWVYGCVVFINVVVRGLLLF